MTNLIYIQVIYLLSNIFRVFSLNLYFELFFSKKNLWCSAWIKRTSLVGYYLINSSIYLLIHHSIVTLLSNVILFLLLTIPYKSSIWRRIFAVSSIFVLGMICEGIVGKTAMWFLKDIDSILIITYIVSNFLLYLVVFLLKRTVRDHERILFPRNYWIALILIPVISSIADVVLVLGGYKQSVNVIIILSLFVINIVFFYLYAQMVDKCEIEIQNQALQQQNKAYQQQISVIQKSEEMINRIKHDYRNHIFAIKNLIDNKQVIELKNYLEVAEEMVSETIKYVSTGNTVIDGLINYKLNVIRESGATIEINMRVPKDIKLDEYDGVVILGNLMDNAISALQGQENGSFAMNLHYDRGILFLHIKNSYFGNLRHEGNNFLTTKTDADTPHGLGLSNVKMTIEKYGGEMKITTKDGYFDVAIMMYI